MSASLGPEPGTGSGSDVTGFKGLDQDAVVLCGTEQVHPHRLSSTSTWRRQEPGTYSQSRSTPAPEDDAQGSLRRS
jgi:hypothetical protein